jgi:hypothetical protein
MSDSKVITLSVQPDYCHVFKDPSNPKVTYAKVLLLFSEAAKLVQGDANLRNPSEKKPVKQMRHTIEFRPELFHRKNNGITYLCSKVEMDKKSGQLTIRLPQSGSFGTLNGGHTLYVVQDSVKKMFGILREKKGWTEPYVPVQFVAGEEAQEDTVDVVKGLNTATAVSVHTEYEYEGKYEDLKLALKRAGFPFEELVAFKENEDREWNVREIVHRMSVFLPSWSVKNISPYTMYRSRGKSMEMFVNKENHKEFVQLYDVIVDIITLPEFIQSQFSTGNILTGKNKKLGRLKIAKLLPGQRVRKGTTWPTEHKMDLAALLPMAAAFRELLVMRNGKMAWSRDPYSIFKKVAVELYDHLSICSARAKSASQLGSDSKYWDGCDKIILKAKADK